MKKKTKEVKNNGPEGTDLFPLARSPLGKACGRFIEATQEIAKNKAKRDEIKGDIIAEMKKENRKSLKITEGNDNWEFSIKAGMEDLRCVKTTRQPAVKVSEE